MSGDQLKRLGWAGNSREALRSLPKAARHDIGRALDRVQRGEEPPSWKPRNDIGRGVIQLTCRDSAGSYRVFYVAKLGDVVWVLHVFQKKSAGTSRADIEKGKEAYRALIRYLTASKGEVHD